MKSLGIVFMGALLLAGCGSVRYPTTYVLNFPPPVSQAPPSTGVVGGPISIRDFKCPEYLCEGRIVYRPTPEEVGFYEYHRWAMNPSTAITQQVVQRLRSQTLFTGVLAYERGADAAYVLSGSIERLEEVDQGRDVRANCTISAQLLNTRTRSVVWSHTVSETVQVEKRDVRGVVNSLSAAADAAVDRLVKSMADELPATIALQPSERREARNAGAEAH